MTLEEVEQILTWNMRKAPADPEVRREWNAELRDWRSMIFQRCPREEWAEQLRTVRYCHRQAVAAIRDPQKAMRMIAEQMLADFWRWQHEKGKGGRAN
jgi:hypothetical protein